MPTSKCVSCPCCAGRNARPRVQTRGVTVTDTSPFALRGSPAEVEEGLAFAPKFDADGLITAVVTDAATGDVLMVAHMNAEALAKTIASGEAWYYSRSRQRLWKTVSYTHLRAHETASYLVCRLLL